VEAGGDGIYKEAAGSAVRTLYGLDGTKYENKGYAKNVTRQWVTERPRLSGNPTVQLRALREQLRELEARKRELSGELAKLGAEVAGLDRAKQAAHAALAAANAARARVRAAHDNLALACPVFVNAEDEADELMQTIQQRDEELAEAGVERGQRAAALADAREREAEMAKLSEQKQCVFPRAPARVAHAPPPRAAAAARMRRRRRGAADIGPL